MGIGDVVVLFFITIGKILLAPFTYYHMLWIIVPVYLNWLFTEFYQEKKGTSMGNAITNGFVALWVGIDWTRTTADFLTEKGHTFIQSIPKIAVALLMISYGIIIIVFGVRGKKAIKFIGRVREVTYLTVMLTPVFYGVIPLSWSVVLSIIIFFPMFYGLVELADYFLPTPSIYDEEKSDAMPDMGASSSEHFPSPSLTSFPTTPPQFPSPSSTSQYPYPSYGSQDQQRFGNGRFN